MSLENDVNAVKTDASKVASTVATDVSKLKADEQKVVAEVETFWGKTWTTKVLAVAVGIALFVGFVVGHF